MKKSAWLSPIPAFVVCVFLEGGCAHMAGTAARETVMLPGNVPLEMVWIPPGTFMMGQYANEQDAYPNKETPQHRVTLSHGLWMGKYEVTKEQWQAVMGTAPWSGREYVTGEPKTPAVCVTWDDAQSFAAKVSSLSGRTFRLPTEAEWEWACRAGTATRFYWGDDPAYDDIDRQAWWRGTAMITEDQHARPVGLKPPNPWGLYDMSGNASEWCHDWHSYYAGEPAIDPAGPALAEHRVIRGGSWLTIGGHCRSARRNHDIPSASLVDTGFRVVSGPPVEAQPGAPEFTDVFVSGMDGVNTYRIPAMLLAPDGSVLAFCEARKESIADASPTDMVLRRSVDGGRTWLPMQVLVHGEGNEALMNPCAVVDRPANTIILWCISAHKVRPDHHRHLLLTSTDNGQTWSGPLDAGQLVTNYDDRFVPGPGAGIQTKTGRLVIPGYVGETREEVEEEYFSCVVYSDDHGKNWTFGARVPEYSDESQVVELTDGTLMLNVRGNMGKGCRGVALSNNEGQTWSRFYWDQALNECPCQASIIRCSAPGNSGKDLLLFANPDNRGETYGAVERTRMTVRLSYDEGKTWPVKRLIHGGPSSYSTMVRLPDGDIGLLFEGGEKHRREWVRFVRFSLDWLTSGTRPQP